MAQAWSRPLSSVLDSRPVSGSEQRETGQQNTSQLVSIVPLLSYCVCVCVCVCEKLSEFGERHLRQIEAAVTGKERHSYEHPHTM